ncbi:hypothetical protein LguiB_030811 [Lonicera macranthoides]
MGKFMRKAKITRDVAAVMDLSQSSSLGVRTRAKTLALQRLQSQNPNSSNFLELRSRRLEKPPLVSTPKDSSSQNPNPNSNPTQSSKKQKEGYLGEINTLLASKEDDETGCDNCDLGVQVSFGENNLDFDGRERSRSTRESTPCSLIRDSDTIGTTTPGSSTRPTSLSTRRIRPRNIPTAHELEEFFTHAEREDQRLFTEKYNFDVVNDVPLEGRYEWVRLY